MPPQKIDLQQSYPCVCPRKGKLNPIALTDALGCDRCASIFTLSEDGESLVQLDSIDPFQGSWYWEGKGWRPHRSKKFKHPMRNYTEFRVILIFSLLIFGLLIFSLFRKAVVFAPQLLLVVASIFILLLSLYLLVQMRP